MRISKVVTKTGDSGSTGLIGGERSSKASLRVDAYGEIDELNSCLGLAVSCCQERSLVRVLEAIQHQLFTVGCDLAAPEEQSVPRVSPEQIDQLEQEMEQLMDELPPLEEFILPGGGQAGSALHLARTVCRRSERSAVLLSQSEAVNSQVIIYLNRLSDFLFVAARVQNRREGHPETLAQFSSKKSRKPEPG
jgi:cob(I)alamin adenosyltransferase